MGSSHCQTLIDKLLFRAATQTDQTLYTFLDGRGRASQSLTYGSLLSAVQKMGRWLSESSEVGDRVAIQLPTSADFVITFFACLYTARIPVPLSSPNRKYKGDHYQKVFADCAARLVVTQESIASLYQQTGMPEGTQVKAFPELADQDPLTCPVRRGRYDIAFLQYTSGSTSFPKGVKVSPANIMANQRMIERTFGHSSSSVGLAWVPLFHDMGLIGSVIQPLYVGFPCHFIAPMTFIKRPRLWLELIDQKQVTTTGGPNFAYDLCVNRIDPNALSPNALSSWQVAYNGAEHIKLSTLEQFTDTFAPYGFKSSTFLPCYGLAEATLIVSGVDIFRAPTALSIPCSGDEVLDADAAEPAEHTRTVVSSGVVMPELSLKVIDPKTLQECLPYRVGEIWIAGESISQGYWRKPDKNAETFVQKGEQRFLRTGDLGFLSSEKELYLTGRLKDLIVIEGTNYYPEDIEETAQQAHLAINNSRIAVFAVTDRAIQKLVVVCEVGRPFSLAFAQHAAEIQAAIKRAVYERYQIAVYDTLLLPTNGIPKTTSGKIQRQRTKLLYLVGQLPLLSQASESMQSPTLSKLS